MQFRKRALQSRIPLEGFWTREVGESFTGKYIKYVANASDAANPRPFYIFEVLDAGTAKMNVANPKKPATVLVVGTHIGVAANWSLQSQIDGVQDLDATMRLTSLEQVKNPKGKQPMTVIQVEVGFDEEEPAAF